MEHVVITEMVGMNCGYLLKYLGYRTEIKTWSDVLPCTQDLVNT